MLGASGTNSTIMGSLVVDNMAAVAQYVGRRDHPDSQATLNCRRKVPLESLVDTFVGLARQLRPPFGELAFYPCYDDDDDDDDDYFLDHSSVLLHKGAFAEGALLSFHIE